MISIESSVSSRLFLDMVHHVTTVCNSNLVGKSKLCHSHVPLNIFTAREKSGFVTAVRGGLGPDTKFLRVIEEWYIWTLRIAYFRERYIPSGTKFAIVIHFILILSTSRTLSTGPSFKMKPSFPLDLPSPSPYSVNSIYSFAMQDLNVWKKLYWTEQETKSSFSFFLKVDSAEKLVWKTSGFSWKMWKFLMGLMSWHAMRCGRQIDLCSSFVFTCLNAQEWNKKKTNVCQKQKLYPHYLWDMGQAVKCLGCCWFFMWPHCILHFV